MDLKVLIGLREEVDAVVSVITAPVLQSETKKKSTLLLFLSIALILINLKYIKFTEISLLGFTIESSTPEMTLVILKAAVFALFAICINGAMTDYQLWSRKLIISFLKTTDITNRLKNEHDIKLANFEKANTEEEPYRTRIKQEVDILMKEYEELKIIKNKIKDFLEYAAENINVVESADLETMNRRLLKNQVKLSSLKSRLEYLTEELKEINIESRQNYENYDKNAKNLQINLKDLSNSFKHIKYKKIAIITFELGLPLYTTLWAFVTSLPL